MLNMRIEKIKPNWNEQKVKLKLQFPVLTDSDLLFKEGKKEEMFGKIQSKLGKTREEFRAILAAL